MSQRLLFALLLLTLFSCNIDVVDSYTSTNLNLWKYNNHLTANLNINESVKDIPLNLNITVGHNDDYPFENLYIKYAITSNGDTLSQDVHSVQLQNDLGAWKGEAKGGKFSYSETLVQGLIPKDSQVNVSVSQYSRMDELPGIEFITLSLAKGGD